MVNAIELRIDNLDLAPEVAEAAERIVGPKLAATTWMEQNRQIFTALRMEKAVTIVTIGLIELVAALNILVALVMMVMEKSRDIAVLMSMGARREQIRRDLPLSGPADRNGGDGDWPGRRVHALFSGEPLSLDSPGRRGLLAQLRSVRTALGGRPLDRGGRHPGELPGDALPLPQRHPHRSRRSAAVRVANRRRGIDRVCFARYKWAGEVMPIPQVPGVMLTLFLASAVCGQVSPPAVSAVQRADGKGYDVTITNTARSPITALFMQGTGPLPGEQRRVSLIEKDYAFTPREQPIASGETRTFHAADEAELKARVVL